MITAKRFLPYLLIIILILIIKNNTASIFNSLQNANTAKKLEAELEAERKENKYLNEQFKYVKTDEFIKDQAQTKLGLLKQGEYFVIAPTSAPLGQTKIGDDRPNWKKWWELFF